MPLAAAIRDLPIRADFQPGAGQITQPSNSAVCLGKWRLEAVIANGRWNRVYRAVNAAGAVGSAQFAIKALHEHHWSDPLAIARLRTEATVGRCVIHSHLSSIVAAHVHQQPYYLVMPLLRGSNAADVLKARGRFQVPLAL